MDEITGFLSLKFLPISWSYLEASTCITSGAKKVAASAPLRFLPSGECIRSNLAFNSFKSVCCLLLFPPLNLIKD